MITNFDQMFEQLRSKPKKRLVAAWGVDDHTISAVYMAVEAGIVEGILVGDEEMIKKVCAENNYDITKLTVVNNNPWRRKWHPVPEFLSGKSHGQRGLVGYSPIGLQRVGHN